MFATKNSRLIVTICRVTASFSSTSTFSSIRTYSWCWRNLNPDEDNKKCLSNWSLKTEFREFHFFYFLVFMQYLVICLMQCIYLFTMKREDMFRVFKQKKSLPGLSHLRSQRKNNLRTHMSPTPNHSWLVAKIWHRIGWWKNMFFAKKITP